MSDFIKGCSDVLHTYYATAHPVNSGAIMGRLKTSLTLACRLIIIQMFIYIMYTEDLRWYLVCNQQGQMLV